jgi:steroid 5-alpha reductase family enzyme
LFSVDTAVIVCFRLIDPYWTIIPLLIGQFYYSHPLANGHPLRRTLVMGLLWVWSLRLTYSYFRREEWSFGAREDWRFAELRQKYPRIWWWSSFFMAYVSQHLFLFGITLPLWPAFADPTPQHVSVVDWACVGLSLFGILLAERSDSVLRNFMQENERREAQGQPKQLLLNKGPWKYSRHPNYGQRNNANDTTGAVWFLCFVEQSTARGTDDLKMCVVLLLLVCPCASPVVWCFPFSRRAAALVGPCSARRASGSQLDDARCLPEFGLPGRGDAHGRSTHAAQRRATRGLQAVPTTSRLLDSVLTTHRGDPGYASWSSRGQRCASGRQPTSQGVRNGLSFMVFGARLLRPFFFSIHCRS